MPHGPRHDDVPCPVCGKERSRRQLWQHIEQAHVRDGRKRQQELGRKGAGGGKGKDHELWWKKQLERWIS